ncbi:adhesin [Streptomyces californicus]
MDTEADVTHPVGIDMVHRTRSQDAFPRDWMRLEHDRFSVTAVLPHDHAFFAPLAGDRHDPLLVAEAMRQAAMLAFHAGYGVPMGHHFLLSGLDFVCHLEHLGVGGGPAEIGARGVDCSTPGGVPGCRWRWRVTWAVHRDGGLAATGIGVTRFISPEVYRRMRGTPAAEGISIPRAAPVRADLAGRARTEDVVLSVRRTGTAAWWELRGWTPGTRRCSSAPTTTSRACSSWRRRGRPPARRRGPGGIVPAEVASRFHRYAEFDSPCLIGAVVRPGPAEGR